MRSIQEPQIGTQVAYTSLEVSPNIIKSLLQSQCDTFPVKTVFVAPETSRCIPRCISLLRTRSLFCNCLHGLHMKNLGGIQNKLAFVIYMKPRVTKSIFFLYISVCVCTVGSIYL